MEHGAVKTHTFLLDYFSHLQHCQNYLFLYDFGPAWLSLKVHLTVLNLLNTDYIYKKIPDKRQEDRASC